MASTGSQWLKLDEVVQAMVAKAGFRVKLNQMDEAAFYATRKEGKLPMYTSKWSADFNDPDKLLLHLLRRQGHRGPLLQRPGAGQLQAAGPGPLGDRLRQAGR